MNENGLSPEDRLIARHFAPLAKHPGAFGLTDDVAAMTPPPGCDLVVTADALVAGVHFFHDDAPGDIARKSLRVNLSDLAAKGATPIGYLLSLALPKDIGDAWLADFASGLRDDAERYGCSLLGGDTVRTPGPVTISIAMLGHVPQGAMVRRSGAKPGDRVFVTGTIGDAALGLVLRQGAKLPLGAAQWAHLLSRYLLPQPRLALADALRAHASAAMDVSDGLAGDLAKLARVSGVAALIDMAHLPLSEAARAAIAADGALMETALTGGDDYEIVCTVSPANAPAFRSAAQTAQVVVTEIGEIAPGTGTVFSSGGKPLAFKRAAFSHF